MSATNDQQLVPRILSFSDLMHFGIKQGWTTDQLVNEAKRKFGRIRQGVKTLRRQYEDMISNRS